MSSPDLTRKEEVMKPNPQRAAQLLSQLAAVSSRIHSTKQAHNISKPIRLVAVSKLKPLTDIIALASSANAPGPQPTSNLPHLHFGENYVQELLEKSKLLPPELQQTIRWHFIGGLQSNKCQTLARDVHGLWAVESVDSVKKASLLDKGRGERKKEEEEEEPLRVFVQVNTSGEESKSGLEPQSEQLLELCRHVRDNCANLRLQGLMTIGALARSQATTAENENEDFVCLKDSRDWVAAKLEMSEKEGQQIELSMGMSEDFEGAIVMGSDEVRVGSTIFGDRPPKNEAKIL